MFNLLLILFNSSTWKVFKMQNQVSQEKKSRYITQMLKSGILWAQSCPIFHMTSAIMWKSLDRRISHQFEDNRVFIDVNIFRLINWDICMLFLFWLHFMYSIEPYRNVKFPPNSIQSLHRPKATKKLQSNFCDPLYDISSGKMWKLLTQFAGKMHLLQRINAIVVFPLEASKQDSLFIQSKLLSRRCLESLARWWSSRRNDCESVNVRGNRCPVGRHATLTVRVRVENVCKYSLESTRKYVCDPAECVMLLREDRGRLSLATLGSELHICVEATPNANTPLLLCETRPAAETRAMEYVELRASAYAPLRPPLEREKFVGIMYMHWEKNLQV